jgi:hypothetical protein
VSHNRNNVACYLCGRIGTRGFVVSSGNNELDYNGTTWRCESDRACDRRRRAAEEVMFRDRVATSGDKPLRPERVTARSRVASSPRLRAGH